LELFKNWVQGLERVEVVKRSEWGIKPKNNISQALLFREAGAHTT
jgi:hypothetical protein